MTAVSQHFVPGLSLTAEQVADRRNRLGASEMPVVLGLSKWKSPVALWAEKRGLLPLNMVGNEFTEWGTRLEAVVADAYAEKNDVVIMPMSTVIASNGWRSASPDRKVMSREQFTAALGGAPTLDSPWLRGLEVKCRGDYSASDFGEPGTDQIPDEVAIQCHSNMSVLREKEIMVDQWDVATLIGGNRYRQYRVYYDKDIDAALTQAAHDFWHKYVLPGVEPPIDGSEATTEYLRGLFKSNNETLLIASAEQEVAMLELKRVREQIKELDTREQELKNQLMAQIGENAGLESLRLGKITWKAPTGVQTKWKEVAEELRASAELIKKHSTPMGRRFVPYFKKDR